MPGALILSARFDERAQGYFQRMRDTYFPPELNIVPAHLTLFHKLPGDEHEAICAAIAEECDARAPLPARVADVRFFGRGGGFVVRCEELDAVRAALARRFKPWLTEQDRQPHRPHVTYQNKVTKERARAAHEEVLRGFGPFDATVAGLDLWWYRRHWDPAGSWDFAG